MVQFNVPPRIGTELSYLEEVLNSNWISGDGKFTKLCKSWMEERFGGAEILLTTSGTTALDMAVQLCGLGAEDEVILPSYTFSSTATAPVSQGAKLVFVDIRPDTMNIDETKIEPAITNKTKAIIVMHYAGVACEMDAIMEVARRHNLFVIEDAAQGVMSQYKGRYLGTIGDFGCYSFHETKNYSMGEGGAIVINDGRYIECAEIMREKGTNRSKFYRGQVDKYTWVDKGDSYLPSELNAAVLWSQLEKADEIYDNRMDSWNYYKARFSPLVKDGKIEIQNILEATKHNAHMFYIKLKDLEERSRFIKYMKAGGVSTVFHYIPLHSSPAGLIYGRFCGEDLFTTRESERLVRLPLYYNMTREELYRICDLAVSFFK